jgi:hypothetical protein
VQVSYRILEQSQGKKKPKTLCKHVRFFPKKKFKGQIEFLSGFGIFGFPILKIVVATSETAKRQFVITWSNFHGERGLSPGKFVIRQVSRQPKMVYVMNSGNRKMMHNRKPVLDYVAMSVHYGTNLENGELVIGPKHPLEQIEHFKAEVQTVQALGLALAAKFGVKIAGDVVGLFLSHSIFQAFATGKLRKAA